MRLAHTLAIAALLCCLLLIGEASIHAQNAPLAGPTRVYLPLLSGRPGVQTPEQRAAAARVLTLINEHRAAAGCPALVADERLTAAAQRHSDDMAENNFFDHSGSSGSNVADRANSAGYAYRSLGENIAAGQSSPEAVVAGWMSSPGHRANILNCSYRHTGVGFNYQANDMPLSGYNWPFYRYWTQVFGSPQ